MIRRNKREANAVEFNTWFGGDPSRGGVLYVLVGDSVMALVSAIRVDLVIAKTDGIVKLDEHLRALLRKRPPPQFVW